MMSHQLLKPALLLVLLCVVSAVCCLPSIVAARRDAHAGKCWKLNPWNGKVVDLVKRAANKADVVSPTVIEAYKNGCVKDDGYKVCVLFSAWSNRCIGHLQHYVVSLDKQGNIEVRCTTVDPTAPYDGDEKSDVHLLDSIDEYEVTTTTALSPDTGVSVTLVTCNSWVMMQRKITGGSVSFRQNWTEYRDGFGSATSGDNYWLGLEKVYVFQQLGSVSLRVEIQRTDGIWYWADYASFSITDEASNYRLTVNGYSGDAGDAMAGAPADLNANGRMFSTADNDNDGWSENCGRVFGSGYWYDRCSASDCNYNGNGFWTDDYPIVDTVQASRMWIRLNNCI